VLISFPCPDVVFRGREALHLGVTRKQIGALVADGVVVRLLPDTYRMTAVGTILETNGRRWHDDPTDYERDNEKWSVPGRHGYRIVFATWEKVTRTPLQLSAELSATLTATALRQDLSG